MAQVDALRGHGHHELTQIELNAGIVQSDIDPAYPVGHVFRYGAKGDGSFDDSGAFSKALTIGNIIVWIPMPPTGGSYQLDGSQILVATKTHIHCAGPFTVQKTANGVDGGWIRWRDVTDCSFEGNGSTWEYATKPTELEEQRHIFDIRGVTNFWMRDVIAAKSGGDGFWIGQGAVANFSLNVRLYNIKADDNRRSGCSIISAIDCSIDGADIRDTDGTAPQNGFAIEPNTSTDELKGIRLKNITTRNCTGAGMYMTINDLVEDYELDIIIDGHTDIGSGTDGVQFNHGTKMLGRVQYNDGTLINNGDSGIYVKNWKSTSAHIDINLPTVINPNVNNDSSNAQIGNGIVVYAPNTDDNDDIGNVTIREPRCIDNRSTPQMKNGVLGQTNVTLGTVRNIDVIDPIEISGVGSGHDQVSLISVVNYLVTDRRRILKRDNTANGNVSISDHYSIETNRGASGTITLTLDDDIHPGPSLFKFEVREAQELRVDPEAGGIILPGGALGTLISSQTIGDTLILRKGTRHTDTFVDGNVNTGTDQITVTGHPFTDVETVVLSTDGVLPAGTNAGDVYYIDSVDANTVALYTDQGLSAGVDITAASGGGTHTIAALAWYIEDRDGLWAFSASSPAQQTYSESNVSADRTFDANAAVTGTGIDVAAAGPANVALLSDHDALVAVVQELADVVGTIVVDLRARGFVD